VVVHNTKNLTFYNLFNGRIMATIEKGELLVSQVLVPSSTQIIVAFQSRTEFSLETYSLKLFLPTVATTATESKKSVSKSIKETKTVKAPVNAFDALSIEEFE
jgi:hypothetical protein